MAKTAKNTNYRDCNLLAIQADRLHLWRFYRGSKGLSLAQHLDEELGFALPARHVDKSWKQVFQPRLNIAWTSKDLVYLKVAHLPTDNPDEVGDMLELQIEQLSPIPLSQLVWTYEIYDSQVENQITVCLFMAEARRLDHLLDEMESHGFQPDSALPPQLAQIWAIETPEDTRVYIFPEKTESGVSCFSAWFSKNTLQFLQNFSAGPEEPWEDRFLKRFQECAWAGEMEGWLEEEPRITLAADEAIQPEWKALLGGAVNSPIDIQEVGDEDSRVSRCVEKVSKSEFRSNLLPAERHTRYRDRFVDGVFISSAIAAVAVYAICLVGYFAVLKLADLKQAKIDSQIAATAPYYTNTLQLGERIDITERQLRLRYAALDCWSKVVSATPDELTFRKFDFQKGETLVLSGEAAPGTTLTEFIDNLRALKIDEKPLFSDVQLQSQSQRGSTQRWVVNCELNGGSDS